MSLNIKNPEVYKLAHELADVTGESVTAAVLQAVKERLGRVRRETDEEFVQRWMKGIHEHRALWKEPYLSRNHGDLLYDERGLPK